MTGTRVIEAGMKEVTGAKAVTGVCTKVRPGPPNALSGVIPAEQTAVVVLAARQITPEAAEVEVEAKEVVGARTQAAGTARFQVI